MITTSFLILNKSVPNKYLILKDKNIKCLLFDLDNTCVPYPQKTPTEELKTLFKKLQEMDFKVIIFSNTTPNRLDKFKDIGVEVFGLSRKPSKKNFYKILTKYFYQKKEACIIGDQLFTDILGGNKVGIHTLLVDPLGPKDFIGTKLSRLLEKIVFNTLSKKKIHEKGVYYYDR